MKPLFGNPIKNQQVIKQLSCAGLHIMLPDVWDHTLTCLLEKYEKDWSLGDMLQHGNHLISETEAI